MEAAISLPAQSTDRKIHPLTSARFFAALYVVLFHTAPLMQHRTATPTWLEALLAKGYVSVSFFFLLSGYILAVVYLRSDHPFRSGRFLVARFARIYPLLLLALLLDVPNLFAHEISRHAIAQSVANTAAMFLTDALLLQAWSMRLQGLDAPSWSLSAEAVFYLLFPLIGLALWRLKGYRLLTASAVIYISGQLAVWFASGILPDSITLYQPLLHLPSFALGICLAKWQLSATLDRHPPAAGHIYLVLACSLAIFLFVLYGRPLAYVSLQDGLLAPLFAALIWALSYPHTRLSRWLSHPLLVLLGEASYGLYLIHMPVLRYFDRLGRPPSGGLYLVYLGLCLALSVLSFSFFETPARRWLLRTLRVTPRETPEVASIAQ